MSGWQGSAYWVPFPGIPKDVKAKYSISDLFLRAFGFFEEDLTCDFNQSTGPHLVTQILQGCTRDGDGQMPDQAFFWDLTIGKQIECLLTIAALTPGNPSTLTVRLRCSSATCQQQMEMDISVAELARLQHQADDTDHHLIELAGENINVRNPTGRDQLAWLKHSFTNEKEAAEAMVRSLIVDTEDTPSSNHLAITDEVLGTIKEAMEESDPLVNFSLQVRCPYCSEEDLYELNLEELSVQKLYESRLNLLKAIHRLATQYHWSEQQILSIPPWRRSHYLALIGKEETR